MSTEKTIDISVLPEAEQDLIKALFDKCCERVNQKVTEVKPRIWKPKHYEKYHYIDGSGAIYSAIWFNSISDNGRWNLGNVFKTQKEAEFARAKQKIKTKLQRYADEHNDPNKEKWDGENVHCRIGYSVDKNDLDTVFAFNVRHIGDIYFTSEEIAEDAANKVGAERILKYLFDVDCEVDE